MCYDVSFTVDVNEIATHFPTLIPDDRPELGFDTTHIVAHSYNEHPIIYKNRDDHQLHLRNMRWGCIPFYINDLKKFAKQRTTMLNARSERILGDEKSYWYKVRNRRCLIPLNGIYEHRGIEGWKHKVPYYVHLKDQPLFFLPGLYSVANIADLETGEVVPQWTYTLITRPANDLMKQIHNEGENKWRMPLFLPFELSRKWVSEDISVEDYRALLNYEMPSTMMEAWPVFSIRTTKPRPDNKGKNERYEWVRLPVLK